MFLRISIVLTGLALLGSSISIHYFGIIEQATNRIIGDYQESAVRLRNMGDYDQALQILNEALSEYPYDWRTYLYRAEAYYLKGDYDMAILDCNKSISFQDKYVYVAYFLRGSFNAGKKEWDKALSDFSEALKLCPDESSLSERDIKASDIHERIEKVKQEKQGGRK